jgi:hypothetical protein
VPFDVYIPPVGELSAALAVLEGIESVIVMPGMSEDMLDISISASIFSSFRKGWLLVIYLCWIGGKSWSADSRAVTELSSNKRNKSDKRQSITRI